MKIFRRGGISRREMRRWDMAYAAKHEWLAWHQADSLRKLGNLTAGWLEGDIATLPMYMGTPADETKPLIPYLAAYNRAGFITNGSQPGIPRRNHGAQRAWVEGWCTEATAERIDNALLGTDLIVGRTPPGSDAWTRICVTSDAGRVFTTACALTRDYLIEQYREELPAAIPALLGAWQVFVVDPVWGRNDVLWKTLASVLVPVSDLLQHGLEDAARLAVVGP